MKRPDLLIYIAFLIPLIYGCGKNDDCISSPDISGIQVDLNIERVDLELMDAKNPQDMAEVLKKHKMFSEIFLIQSQYPHDSIFYNSIYRLFQDPHIDTLHAEVRRVFGDIAGLQYEFEEGFRRLKAYYPDFKAPRIETVLSGFSKDMYVSDTLIIIGLDYYLGTGAKYLPVDFPDYIQKRYQPRNLVPNTFMFISQFFSKSDPGDNSLLADMIFYGKAYQFTKQLLPCLPDSVMLGYTPDEMDDIESSQEIIWANFIQNEALFTTDQYIKDKFISERPKTFEIGENCPGRIGRWIGWNIIKSFLERNPDLTLPQLMAYADAGEIFSRSRFKPRNGSL